MTKQRIMLFLAAFLQVMFVTMNVHFISRGLVLPMLVTSFVVSLVWTLNVKLISIGSMTDRTYYAAGAMCGTGLGYFISHNIITSL